MNAERNVMQLSSHSQLYEAFFAHFSSFVLGFWSVTVLSSFTSSSCRRMFSEMSSDKPSGRYLPGIKQHTDNVSN